METSLETQQDELRGFTIQGEFLMYTQTQKALTDVYSAPLYQGLGKYRQISHTSLKYISFQLLTL